jgi:hypothetical protein
LEDQGVNGRMGSEWDWLGVCRLDPVGSGYGPVAGSCEYGDEPPGSGATELVREQTRQGLVKLHNAEERDDKFIQNFGRKT